MTQNRANPVLQRIGFAALLAIILAGCGGDTAPTPPAPPPFRPQSITVNLGDNGGSITLMTTATGGYTRDGQAFTSGTEVEAENGSRYRVTLTGQTWSAEFLPPDPVEVQLGTSGDTVSITQLEDRSYQADGQPLGEDRTVTADNGNRYQLTLGDSGWSWDFLPPDAVSVDLGTSGDTVSITQQEDQSYSADGQPLGPDRIVTADNGNQYRLTLGDTGWSGEFVPPDPVSVTLGTSGTTVSITQQEDRSYLVDGNPLMSNGVVEAANGSRYRLALGESGWSWEFVPPDAVSVTLGTSGDMVLITQQEDGSYLVDGNLLSADRIVTASNENQYRLTRGPAGWSWEFVPPPAISLALGSSGTTVMITQAEDRSYLVDGQPLPGDRIVPADNGARYRLTLDLAGWSWAFVPADAIALALGTSGDSVLITQLEDRSYEVNGEALPADGIVPAANGNRYRLVMTAGVWSWEFVAPPAVSVQLGTSGTTVMVTQLEDRSYAVDGTPLPTDGIVPAANENRYRLTMVAGAWSSEFVPPPAVSVQLGTSGTTVMITQLEDRSYAVDGSPIPADGVVEAANGRRYRLVLRAGVWSGMFVQPDAQAVPLGISGTAVLVTQNEEGTILVNGQAISQDRIVTAANGYRYRLDLRGSEWSAVFATSSFQVSLGRLGGTRTLELRAEDGPYWLGNTEVNHGDIITGDNQKRYKLEFRSGVWFAVHQADVITVLDSGSGAVALTLTQLEDDAYYFNNREVQSGDTVTVDGNEYTLTFDSTTRGWTAMAQVVTVDVQLGTSGGTKQLTRRIDGTFEDADGEAFPTGSRVRGDDGQLYRLVLGSDGTWTAYIDQTGGVVPAPDPNTPTTRRSDNLETEESLPATNPPTFKTADGSPDPDEGTTLVVTGATSGSTDPQEYSIHDLVGRGVVTDSRTYIDAARAEIQKIRKAIQTRVDAGVYETGGLNPHDNILGTGQSWDQLKAALAIIFGSATDQATAAEAFLGDPPTGRRDDTLDADEVADVLEVIDDILDSISTLAKFEEEVYGDLVKADGTALDLSAKEVYEAAYSKLQFGSTRNTRFAAYGIQHNTGSASEAASWDVGAFAYSPLEVSTRSMLPHRGEAEFEGETIAVQASTTAGGDTTVYSGDIELKVRFSIGRVLGLITNLRDEDNKLWTYDGTAVQSIRLPIGAMGTGDATFAVTGTADLRFVSDTPASTFRGKFVGDDSDEADAVVGTWTIAEVTGTQGALSGAFGAEYTRTRTSTRPALESSPRGSRAETSIDFTLDTDGEVALGSFTGLTPARMYSRATSIYRSTTAGQTLSVTLTADESLKLTVSSRNTDFTRYGVWEQEKTDSAANTVVVEQQGVFAYSYLEPTVFSTEPDSDHVYPRNVEATYSGQTIAQDRADDPAIYIGSIELTVNWNAALSAAVLDSAVIRNLRRGNTYFAIGGEAVDRIVMTEAVTWSGETDGIKFVSTTSGGMEVWYRDTLLNRSRLGGSHDGNFVGLSLDGPVAVIGKWSVLGTDSSVLIQGAYGAHLQP